MARRFVALALLATHCAALAVPRRLAAQRAAAGASAAAAAALSPREAGAATLSLRDTLAARDAALLKKPFLSARPGPQAFPDWLEGTWRCEASFRGYEFPSKTISKARVVANTDLAGFTKLSVARFGDVGRESTVYDVAFARSGGRVYEDLSGNLRRSLAAHAGGDDGLVRSVDYDAGKNPNRVTVDLREGGRNGERIELFVNARRDEALGDDFFLNAESIRQMTLGGPTLQNPTQPRIVISEYQHYYTWRRLGPDAVKCNVLTAVYVVPQDNMFPEAFDLPVVVYAHDLRLARPGGASGGLPAAGAAAAA